MGRGTGEHIQNAVQVRGGLIQLESQEEQTAYLDNQNHLPSTTALKRITLRSVREPELGVSETSDEYGESANLAVQKGERFFASIGLRDEHGGLRVLGKHDNDVWTSRNVEVRKVTTM